MVTVKDVRGQTDTTLEDYFNIQLAESLKLVFTICAVSSLLFILSYWLRLASLPNPQQLFTVNLALFVFFLSMLAMHRFASPPPKYSHASLTLGAVASLVAASYTSYYGMHDSFTDVVTIILVASGVFALDYSWLLVINLCGHGIWFLTHQFGGDPPRGMEISSLAFASITSFLLCYIRRETYQQQHTLNHRRRLTNEKLEGLRLTTQLQRKELETQIGQLVQEKSEVVEAIDRKSESVNQLRENIQCSRDSESLGRMAGGVAHDFNNLLTVLFFNLDELSDSTDRSEVRHDLREARSAARKVTDLTSQLLALSRRQVLKRKLINPEYHIQKLRPTIAKLLGEDTDVDLQLNLPAGQTELYADPDLLDQALLALLGMGRSVERRGGLIKVELSADDRWLYYTISHSDWAIPQSESLVLQNPNDDILAVMGLSLSAVEGVVEQHRGKFEARSEKGRTKYRVSLPLSVPEPTAETPQESVFPEPVQGAILILEEDEQVRRLLARFLRKHQYEVH